jgi:putative zinc finger/helix-turn-helix YgiT family protein
MEEVMKCAECGHEMTDGFKDHHYVESGLKNVVLKGIPVSNCPHCGEEEIGIPNPFELENLLACVVAQQPQRLKPEEIRFLRSYLEFTGIEFSKVIAVTPETVSRWENGHEPMSVMSERFLRLLVLSKKEPMQDQNILLTLATEPSKKTQKRVFQNRNHRWKEAA